MDAGIYVHVPFCRRRCPYCAFVLIESAADRHQDFVDAVRAEIDSAPPARAVTICFGGGTPSVLRPDEIGAITGAIRARFGLAGGAEITLEANPEGITAEYLASLPVNRVSLGIQAFDDDDLRFLGREHTAADAIHAYHAAREAGVINVNVDLIAGLPGHTPARWRDALSRAIDLGPEHVSVYGLTIEKGTPFERRSIAVPDEDTQRALYEITQETLEAAGYVGYEISNYARPGFESRHNRLYWTGEPYLGFGPGAHSFVPPERWANPSNVRDYLRRGGRVPPMMQERLTDEQRTIERIFLGLRLAEGLQESDIARGAGWERIVEALQEEGLAVRVEGRLRLTRRGRPVADEVVARLAAAL